MRIYCILVTQAVSTHSRPKAAGKASPTELIAVWFQHTAARRRLGRLTRLGRVAVQFQHTAARRRLVAGNNSLKLLFWVSTHSRPKAAGVKSAAVWALMVGFNTQPPEGGWFL